MALYDPRWGTYDDGYPNQRMATWEVPSTVVEAITQAASQYKVPAALMAAIAAYESTFHPLANPYVAAGVCARSYDQGLFQFNTRCPPGTDFPIDWGRIFDPYYNAELAAHVLVRRFPGGGDSGWYEAARPWHAVTGEGTGTSPGPAWNLYQDSTWRLLWETGTTAWAVEWVSAAVPATMERARVYSVPVSVRNAGSGAWPAGGDNPVRLAYTWLTPERNIVPGDWKDLRTALPGDVAPGQLVNLSMQVQVPTGSGSVLLVLKMLKEGQFWFPETREAMVQIAPGGTPERAERRLLALGAAHDIGNAAEIERTQMTEGDYGEIEIDLAIGFLAEVAARIGQYLVDNGVVLWDEVRAEGNTVVIRFQKTVVVIPIIIAVLGALFLTWLVTQWRLYLFPPKPPVGTIAVPAPGGAKEGGLLMPVLVGGGVFFTGILLSRKPR